MCVIIDANCASLVFTANCSDDMRPLRDAMLQGTARGVYGGKLTEEYGRVVGVWRMVLEMDRAGRMRLIRNEEIDKHLTDVHGRCRSNDAHIIALALASNVRLLCSHDQDLHADFKNKELLKPRGSVYQDRSHAPLIRKHCSNLRF